MKARFGADHPYYAVALNKLGIVYAAQRKYAEAEGRFKRALAIREKALGASHSDVGQSQQEDAADDDAVLEHVVVVTLHWPEEREAFGRLSISDGIVVHFHCERAFSKAATAAAVAKMPPNI